MKKILTMSALAAVLSLPAFAKVPIQTNCDVGYYPDFDGECQPCPSNYNNPEPNDGGDPRESYCCIGNMTYDATTDMCVPVAGTGLTNGATCDSGNLGKSENGSTAKTEAIWNANTININWYNGDTRVAQNTCTYDGQITLPTEPSKPGYTFSGWRLRGAKQCWEITDYTECLDKGCSVWSELGVCKKALGLGMECSSITNETECNGSYASEYFCAWSNGACVPGTYMGGGSSD